VATTTAKRRKSWDLMHMVTTVRSNAVRRTDVGLKKAAKSFNVLISILKDSLKKGEYDVEKNVAAKSGH
jgi:hypothetical protein